MNQSYAKVGSSNHQIFAGYAVSVQAEISKGAVATMGVTGAVAGLWSFASLVGALVVTGGPISLAQSWFEAVIGM